jgi:hypothetical protein
LGQERFIAAWDEGRLLPLEQAAAKSFSPRHLQKSTAVYEGHEGKKLLITES